MSFTIEDLSFVIFANGHDYTLLDSGKGEVQVFSHPYVPLDSVHYAGMWYFQVPDENGEPIDAVKDDLAHCEFTPTLGETFDTEGEVLVQCHYYREYINPESTIIVDKTVQQKITVVDHGTVVNAAHFNNSWNENVRCDIYSDGYVFFRPMNTTEVGAYAYVTDVSSGMVKSSSIPWRASRLGRSSSPLFKGTSFVDISELEYADVSNVTFMSLLQNTSVEELSPLSAWDVSNCEDMRYLCSYNMQLTDISALENWDTSKVTSLYGAFCGNMKLANLHGLEKWDVSKVTNMYGMLSADEKTTEVCNA